MSGIDKDIREYRRELRRQGWREEFTGKAHIKMIHPDGWYVTMSLSPSCPFALKKIKAVVKRRTREEAEKKKQNRQRPALAEV